MSAVMELSAGQGDALWTAHRAGRITASRMKDVLAVSIAKGKEGTKLQAWRDYATELVVERLTGIALGIPSTPAMQWGKQCEEAARNAYEARKGCIVEVPGLIAHPTLIYVAASPDGKVGNAKGVEIKCPFNMVNHLETLRGGMPDEHRPQIQAQMWVTGWTEVDFVSFDPRYPAKYRLYVQTIQRDDKYIANMASACEEMNAYVVQALAELESPFSAASGAAP
jgi:putative phage-type endonuclease